MKFLIDVCAGRMLGEWLISIGHNVLFVTDKDSKMGDEDILDWANNEDRILITLDKDFGYHIFFVGLKHKGIIRLPNVPREVRIKLMKNILKKYSKDLENNAIITVAENRIRIRRI
jgi:predicted nuclease of predicted toxin-antitoxin system